ncbi:MAG: Rieske 2Fe-2S domain-containing protein [Alphaproteobacteria bacterium]|nr:Rieske 2Fe-2S domain-containing protein [Alphaproteobacteria bacterium]
MFEDIANIWTIVGLARDLKRAAPLAMRIAGEGVVFFREAGGKASAHIDRCLHRGIGLAFDNQRFVRCSIFGLALLNVGRLAGTSVSVPRRSGAAAP